MLVVGNALVGEAARRANVFASVIALDFDGVLCDSEPELTRSAWRTAVELWPDRMVLASELDPKAAGARRAWVGGNWDGLKGEDEEGLPAPGEVGAGLVTGTGGLLTPHDGLEGKFDRS